MLRFYHHVAQAEEHYYFTMNEIEYVFLCNKPMVQTYNTLTPFDDVQVQLCLSIPLRP